MRTLLLLSLFMVSIACVAACVPDDEDASLRVRIAAQNTEILRLRAELAGERMVNAQTLTEKDRLFNEKLAQISTLLAQKSQAVEVFEMISVFL